MTAPAKDLVAAAKRIRLLALDVDGVMTDGTVFIGQDREVTKRFNIRDGHALVMLPRHGIELAILSGRRDGATSIRAKELGFKYNNVKQGLRKKLPAAQKLADALSIGLDEIAYMGDDINDVPVIEAVGLGAAPADAAAEARLAARYVSPNGGGAGAVRDLCELLLKSRGEWQTVLDAMR